MKPKKSPSSSGPRTDWGGVAEWYDELVGDSGSEYHREVVLPGVLRLMAMMKGEKAIDIACGQGVLCRLLHERGVEAIEQNCMEEHFADGRMERQSPEVLAEAGQLFFVSECPDVLKKVDRILDRRIDRSVHRLCDEIPYSKLRV